MGPSLLAFALSLGVVVVDVRPTNEAAARVIVEACNQGLGGPRCASARQYATQTAPTLRVRVALRDLEVHRARIELVGRDVTSEPRVLEFAPGDALAERYRAIGLVIASRVLELEQRDTEARPGAPGSITRVTPGVTPSVDSPELAVDLALLTGPGLREGPWRAGALLRGRLALAEPLALLLTLRGATGLGEPTALFTEAGLGLALALTRGALRVEARSELIAERIDIGVEAESGARDRGHVVRTGGALGLDAVIVLGPRWSLLAGCELRLLLPKLVVDVRSREAYTQEGSQLALTTGVRFGF